MFDLKREKKPLKKCEKVEREIYEKKLCNRQIVKKTTFKTTNLNI
jgi:hypothetical protein